MTLARAYGLPALAGLIAAAVAVIAARQGLHIALTFGG